MSCVWERARKAAAYKRQPPRAGRAMDTNGDEAFFSSATEDEVGGFPMFAPPISQKGARAQRAPAPAASCVQEEMAERRLLVPPDPTKTAATPANIAASGRP
jgi:hypothetical protein